MPSEALHFLHQYRVQLIFLRIAVVVANAYVHGNHGLFFHQGAHTAVEVPGVHPAGGKQAAVGYRLTTHFFTDQAYQGFSDL